MNMVKYNKTEILREHEWPGILTCKFKHKLADTEASLKYTGPKISHEEWHRLMSFFRWTNETTHSESQARGFVDLTDNKIVFWAFPQKARTGMSAEEVPGEEFNKQRSELPNAGSLTYFMTVHHHCSAGAFQSSGDANNEERPGGGASESAQEGLHITVGNMDKDQHDIDVRFYFGGQKMMPNMSAFWDIGEEASRIIPVDMHDRVARYQMCRKVEVPFPDQWKENLIEIKTVTTYQGGLGYQGGNGMGYAYSFKSLAEKINDEAEELVDDWISKNTIELDDLEAIIKFLNESVVVDDILTRAAQQRFDAIDIRRMIENIQQAFDQEVEFASGDPAAVDKTVKAGDSNKKRKRRKRNHQQVSQIKQLTAEEEVNRQVWNVSKQMWENPRVVDEKAEVTEPPPYHGEVRIGDNGLPRRFDSDLHQWVEDGGTGYE